MSSSVEKKAETKRSAETVDQAKEIPNSQDQDFRSALSREAFSQPAFAPMGRLGVLAEAMIGQLPGSSGDTGSGSSQPDNSRRRGVARPVDADQSVPKDGQNAPVVDGKKAPTPGGDEFSRKSPKEIVEFLKENLPKGDATAPVLKKLNQYLLTDLADPSINGSLRLMAAQVKAGVCAPDALLKKLETQFKIEAPKSKPNESKIDDKLVDSLKEKLSKDPIKNRDVIAKLDELRSSTTVDPKVVRTLKDLNDSFGTVIKDPNNPLLTRTVDQPAFERAIRTLLNVQENLDFPAVIASLKGHLGTDPKTADLRAALDALVASGPVEKELEQKLRGLNDSFGIEKRDPNNPKLSQKVDQASLEIGLRGLLASHNRWMQLFEWVKKQDPAILVPATILGASVGTGVGIALAVATYKIATAPIRFGARATSAALTPSNWWRAARATAGAAGAAAEGIGDRLEQRAQRQQAEAWTAQGQRESPEEARRSLVSGLIETDISDGSGKPGIRTVRGAQELLTGLEQEYADSPERSARQASRLNAVRGLNRHLLVLVADGQGAQDVAPIMRRWAGLSDAIPAVATAVRGGGNPVEERHRSAESTSPVRAPETNFGTLLSPGAPASQAYDLAARSAANNLRKPINGASLTDLVARVGSVRCLDIPDKTVVATSASIDSPQIIFTDPSGQKWSIVQRTGDRLIANSRFEGNDSSRQSEFSVNDVGKMAITIELPNPSGTDTQTARTRTFGQLKSSLDCLQVLFKPGTDSEISVSEHIGAGMQSPGSVGETNSGTAATREMNLLNRATTAGSESLTAASDGMRINLQDWQTLERHVSEGRAVQENDLARQIDKQLNTALEQAEKTGNSSEIERVKNELKLWREKPGVYLERGRLAIAADPVAAREGRFTLSRAMKAAGATAGLLMVIDAAIAADQETALSRARARRDRKKAD